MVEIANQYPAGVLAAIVGEEIITSKKLAQEIAVDPIRYEPAAQAFLANTDQIHTFIAALKLQLGLTEAPLVVQGTKPSQDPVTETASV